MGFGLKDLENDDKLTPDQEQRYEAAFKKYDADGNGRIDTGELAQCLKDCGFALGPLQIRMIMAFSDLDGTRSLPKIEFKCFLGRLSKQRRAFASRDTGKAGKLNQDQLAALLKDMGYNFNDKQVKMLYPMVDRDGNKIVDQEEWLILATFLQFAKLDFINADLDGNGTLDVDEATGHLHKLLGKKKEEITTEFANRVINMVDINKDKKLDFEEFAVLAASAKLLAK